jgi:transposase InsO family protein
MIGEGQAAVFIAVDHCSTECVGIHVSRRATRFEALEPIRQIAAGLAVRHDHGSQYVAQDSQKELAFLGIASSPSFVRAPEGKA